MILVLILVLTQHTAVLVLRRLDFVVVVLLLHIHELILLAFLEDFPFWEASGGHPEG